MAASTQAKPDANRTSSRTPVGIRSDSDNNPTSVRHQSDLGSDAVRQFPHLARIPIAKLTNLLGFQRPEQKGQAAICFLQQRLGGEGYPGRTTFYEWRAALGISPKGRGKWYDEDDLLYLEVYGLYLQVDDDREGALKAAQELFTWRNSNVEQP